MRFLGGLPRYLYLFKIWNLQGPEEDASTPGSSHWSGVVGWGVGRRRRRTMSLASYWRTMVPALWVPQLP